MTVGEDGRRHCCFVRVLVLILMWAVLTGLLIAVGVTVTHSTSVNAFDRHVTSVVIAHRNPTLNAIMKAVTWLGSWVALVATGILVVVLALRRCLPIIAVVLAVVAWAGETGGVTLAKHVVERHRPPQDLRLVSAHGWSWPSGHTAVALLVFTTLALVVVAHRPKNGVPSLGVGTRGAGGGGGGVLTGRVGSALDHRRHRERDLRRRVAGRHRRGFRRRYQPTAHRREW